jgi:hypothetical protein
MVFAVNSDESSARNFSAFQGLAKALNGSATTTTSATPSQTASANTGGAVADFNASMGVTSLVLLGVLITSFF